MADAASVGEIAFIESLMKDYVVEVYTFRNMSYLDCIEPCPYAIPFSDDKTILPIIDTIKFY